MEGFQRKGEDTEDVGEDTEDVGEEGGQDSRRIGGGRREEDVSSNPNQISQKHIFTLVEN